MSLRTFQQIVVDLTLAPWKAKALREGDASVLADIDLTGLERHRILDIIGQPGISVHCSLSRGNRLEVIAEQFPMTCLLLQPVLRDLLNELWEGYRPTNYQLAGEEAAFATMVCRKIAGGELCIKYLDEVFAYEMVCWEMAKEMRSRTGAEGEIEAVVEFQHSPDDLLRPLSQLRVPRPDLPRGLHRARVRLRNGRFDVEMLSASAG